MTPELLRRFYDEWYRPDNAAIMVVGDIDVDEVESEIRQRFEPLTSRGDSTPRTEPTLPAFNTPAATVLLDPDATTGDVEITLPGPLVTDDSTASLRHDTLISLAFDMIATRLSRRCFAWAGAVHDGVGQQQRCGPQARCAERDGQWRVRTGVGVARRRDGRVRARPALRLRRR